MLIHRFLIDSAKRYPDRPAVIHQQKLMTYSRLNDFSDVFAGRLVSENVKKGDRVALFLDNSGDYVIAYFGILKAGAVVVALNSQLVPRELASLIIDCTPKTIVTDSKHGRIIAEALELSGAKIKPLIIDEGGLQSAVEGSSARYVETDCGEHDLAMLIYTSGTTGKPKGVMLSHANVAANAASIAGYLRLSADDKVMVILPFYYSYGMSLLTTHIKSGAALVIDNRFLYPNSILDTMLKEGVTGFAGVPSHFAILLRKSALRNYKFPALRYVTQAGGAMAPEMIREFQGVLPTVKFYVMYGQTEASARLSYLDPDALNAKIGSIGKAIPGVELKVLDEQGKPVACGQTGEIVARGDNVMLGYWNDPVETAKVLRKEGLYTGDLANVDEEGFLYLVSRKKDMIKSGANRISPLEIENVVCGLSGVVECAAVGMPDEILGESIKLFVALNGRCVTKKDIMIYCKQNLAPYKLPKDIVIVESLPKTAGGKIKREELKSIK